MSTTWKARWLDDDGVAVHSATVTLSDDGHAFMRDHAASRTERLRPCKGASGAQGPGKSRTSAGCRKCGRAKIVRWLGVRWVGTPWPVRRWRHLFHLDRRSDWRGCGCMAFPKHLKSTMMGIRAGYARFLSNPESEQ